MYRFLGGSVYFARPLRLIGDGDMTSVLLIFLIESHLLSALISLRFLWRQKGGDLTQSYDKSPYTHGNVKRAMRSFSHTRHCIALFAVAEGDWCSISDDWYCSYMIVFVCLRKRTIFTVNAATQIFCKSYEYLKYERFWMLITSTVLTIDNRSPRHITLHHCTYR